jgi:hypothetical protein
MRRDTACARGPSRLRSSLPVMRGVHGFAVLRRAIRQGMRIQ